jgi:hypothetical protein
MTLDQLKKQNKKQLEELKAKTLDLLLDLESRLENLKASKLSTADTEAEIAEATAHLNNIELALASKAPATKASSQDSAAGGSEDDSEDDSEDGYHVEEGTEKMVHVSIVKGRRFNPSTGKEESAPFVQMFNFGEWQLFKRHFKALGYTIIKALHDPYGDAEDLVTKSK